MKEKMRAKREKHRRKNGKGVPLTTDEQEALESAEAGSELEARILESGELRQSSSEKYTDDAILVVLSELEEKELKDSKTKIINNLLDKTEMTEDEKMSALSRFMAEAEAVNEKFSSIKNYNQAVLAAKLAARKRMKEDLARDKAMKDEVAALAIKQVNE